MSPFILYSNSYNTLNVNLLVILITIKILHISKRAATLAPMMATIRCAFKLRCWELTSNSARLDLGANACALYMRPKHVIGAPVKYCLKRIV